MVHSSTLIIATDDERLTCGGFSLGETIRFGNLEFITNRFDNLSLSPKGSDSRFIFVGMAQIRSPSLHAILEESVGEDDSTSSEGGSSSFPHHSRSPCGDPDRPHRNHTTIGGHSGTSDHTNSLVANRHATANTRLLPNRLWAYQEEQHHVLQANIERRAA
jgi:hypothetical protein